MSTARRSFSAAALRAGWIRCDWSGSMTLQRAADSPAVLAMLITVSRLSDGIVWYAVILLLPWVGGASGTACALRMLCLGALNLLVYKLLKRHVARPRPFVACPGIRACTRSLDEFSFPSGHTLHAVGFSTLLCTYYPGLAWVLWPFTGLVALSRMTLGLHYPSDVAVGLLMGWSIAKMILLLF